MLSNTHLMESELLSNVEGDVTTLKEEEQIITTRPSTTSTSGSTTVSTRPTTAPEAVPTSTSSRPAPSGEQTVLRNPETIVNVNTGARGVPLMIDPIVGVGASAPVFLGGGGGGMAGNRSSAEEEGEEGGEPKKGSGLIWFLITAAVVGGVWYGVKNWK